MKEIHESLRPAAARAGTPLSLKLVPLVCALALPTGALAQALPAADAPPPRTEEPGALAPPAAEARVVKSVELRFRGDATVDRERVLSNMRLKAGETYTPEKVEDDIRALYATGDFIDVQILPVDVAGGVKIVVSAEARAGLGQVEFSGNTVFNTDRLRKEVELKVGGSVNDANLAKAKDTILELYKSKGYPDVTVDYAVRPGAQPGFSRAVFTIDEGGRGIIRNIVFEGNTVFSHRQLKAEVKSDDRNWLKFWDLKRRVERDKVEEDMKSVETYYQDRGYLDARVLGVEPVRVDNDKVDLVFRISEGPRYTVAAVSVAGNKLYQTQDLIPVFQLEAGAIFSLADMKADLQTISDYYGSRGYADADAIPRIDKQPGAQLSIVYAITEGNPYKVGKISISGNQKTRESVIRRELSISPADDYNTIKVRRSQQRLIELDYFEPASVSLMPVSSDLGPDYKDINIDVKEKPTGQVQFGAGFSSIDNLVGFVEVTQRNFDIKNWPSFTGAGQLFKMRLRGGSRTKDFLLSLTEPFFMGQRLALGGDLFYTEKNYLSDDYDQRNIGGSLFMRKPLGEHTEFRPTYTLQQVEIYDMDEDASLALQSEEGDFIQSKLGGALVYDNRNSIRHLITNGHKISLEAAFSGGVLGGDVDVYNVNLAGQKYWSMPWNTVFSVQGEVNLSDTLGDADRVPIFERQFLGGANNLRGFDYRDVGPKDENGEPLGGLTAAYITAEVTFPIINKVRGAFFADAGFVNSDSWDFSGSDYNADIGLGLRLELPFIGPIKLDYGIPVTSDEWNDSGGKFNFSVDIKY